MSLITIETRDNIYKYVKENISTKRLEHTLRVEKVAMDLAKHYQADILATSVAAVLHDACKEMTADAMYEAATSFLKREAINLDISDAGVAIWHGLAAADLGYRRWGIAEPEILYAVAFHTTGWYEMSTVAKILFMADYIEPGRNFKQVKKARRLTYKNLDKATIYQMKQSIRHLAKKEQKIFFESIKIYNHWISK